MLITVDPTLSASGAADVHGRVFTKLRRLAADQVAEDLGDDLAHAEFVGEAEVARDALVRSLGGGRIEVDADIYAQLEEDDGIVVLSADLDEVNPPDPDPEALAAGSSDTYLADEVAEADAQAAALDDAAAAAAQVDAEQAQALAAADAKAPRKAAAKKAPARKRTAAKKAPAKKAAARKSANTTKKAAG